MRPDPRAFLWDVRDAAKAIQSFVDGMDADAYLTAPMVQAAVERKFEIIGEALSQLSKRDAGLANRVPQLAQVVAFRNQLIHGYAAVRHGTVWNIMQDSLPPLLVCVQTLLEELGEC